MTGAGLGTAKNTSEGLISMREVAARFGEIPISWEETLLEYMADSGRSLYKPTEAIDKSVATFVSPAIRERSIELRDNGKRKRQGVDHLALFDGSDRWVREESTFRTQYSQLNTFATYMLIRKLLLPVSFFDVAIYARFLIALEYSSVASAFSTVVNELKALELVTGAVTEFEARFSFEVVLSKMAPHKCKPWNGAFKEWWADTTRAFLKLWVQTGLRHHSFSRVCPEDIARTQVGAGYGGVVPALAIRPWASKNDQMAGKPVFLVCNCVLAKGLDGVPRRDASWCFVCADGIKVPEFSQQNLARLDKDLRDSQVGWHACRRAFILLMYRRNFWAAIPDKSLRVINRLLLWSPTSSQALDYIVDNDSFPPEYFQKIIFEGPLAVHRIFLRNTPVSGNPIRKPKPKDFLELRKRLKSHPI